MLSPRVFLLLLFVSISSFAQKNNAFKQPRVLILLDGSSSMVNEWVDGKQRFRVAGDIITRLVDSIMRLNADVEFSLRVYGHQHGVPENNCFDTRREVMFSKNNLTQLSLRLASLQPLGVSPIAFSLKEAAENDFVNDRDYAYSLILITDGGESCGGNICDVVQNLLQKKIEFKPYIVSLVDYAPLRNQYACLGNYLTVSKPSEAALAIQTITDEYRKVLAVPVAKPKLLDAANIPAPSVQKISVPAVKVAITEPEPKPVTPPPAPPKETPKPAPVQVPPPAASAVPSTSKIKVDTSFFQRDKIAAIRRLGFERIRYVLYLSATTPKKRPVPKFKLPEREADPVTAAPTPPTVAPIQNRRPQTTTIQPAAISKGQTKEAAVSVKLEPAAETSLEIYFTDGKGKYFSTTPPVQLIDVKTGLEVKKFYRTVDAKGNPDPQKVPAGNYTMVIGRSGSYKTKSVNIQAANTNKVNVVVSNGTLIFRYDDNPKRPVNEYLASVRKTFEARTTVVQKCTEEREYEPGNYHIEINTLPMMVRNIDLEFGWSYTIDIPEPGFVQFTNSNAVGKVSLWTPLGDQFARFLAVEVNGDLNAQKLRLQPGIYEAHWKRNPTHPNEPELIERFFVRSNQTTEVQLQ